ncbi:MAG: nitronate monooxygenase, partial [Candidatus Eisenbacteria bacterium]
MQGTPSTPQQPLDERRLPLIIQGGMGVGVSGWKLARTVSQLGQLGVISGTAVDAVFVRRLQDGDPGGHVRRAIAAFPIRPVADRAIKRFFVEGGIPAGQMYRALPMYSQVVTLERDQFTMLSAFAEVYLAKEGHSGLVGMNLLTKIQLPNLALLYGAMLAGVDYILMGAGIPREIPKALDQLSRHEPARLRLDVEDLSLDRHEYIDFDPQRHWNGDAPAIRRPRFLPIIASNSLATLMVRKAEGRVDGFVIEGPTAGGHNAPPRGGGELNERGEPVYGPRDEVDLSKIAELGLPFWIAGGAGWPDRLRTALRSGAAGIQVGTLFAFCDESG